MKCHKEKLHKHEENSASMKSKFIFPPINSQDLWLYLFPLDTNSDRKTQVSQ